MSLESYAHSQSGHGLATSWFEYSSNWDHDKLYGCRCDSKYTGYDCSLRMCPFGDDPMSGLQVDEVQTVSCKAKPDSQGNHFRLKFGGHVTKKILSSASAKEVERAINILDSVEGVTVAVENVGSNSRDSAEASMICARAETSTSRLVTPPSKMKITFAHHPGDVALLVVLPSVGLTMSIDETVKGTKERLECSGRGICNRNTGMCQCQENFDSSDGSGNAGTRGDCGWINDNPWLAAPVTIVHKTLPDAGSTLNPGTQFSVNNPLPPPRTMAGEIARTSSLEAGRTGAGIVLRYERSSRGRIENCFSDCSGNGACGTWTGIAFSYETSQYNDMSNMPKLLPETSLQTVPVGPGDVPAVYTQRTEGLPTFQSGNRRLGSGASSAELITGVDPALVVHARLTQTVTIEGVSVGDVEKNRRAIRAALATAFGVATQDVLIAGVYTRAATSTKNATTDISYFVEVKSLTLETVVSRMQAAQTVMAGTAANAGSRGTLASNMAMAASLNVLRVFLSPVVLETEGTSPEVFARLALGGAEYTCGACQCKCAKGFSAADCSRRACPRGTSWFSLPTDHNVGHPQGAICSDAGICDENSGACICREGFAGTACERLACPRGVSSGGAVCSGHGECLSMRMASQRASIDSGVGTITYGLDPNNGNAWDADHVYGCHCDEGFTGYDCSLRDCDRGDDPRTTGQTFETQVFRCLDASSATPDGGKRQALDTGTNEVSSALQGVVNTADTPAGMTRFFRLSFRGKHTRRIQPGATPSELKAVIEELPNIGRVSVTFHSSATVCASSPGSLVSVEMKTETGGSTFADLRSHNLVPSPPPMTASSEVVGLTLVFAEDQAPTKEIDGVANVNSTREFNTCSDRGLCNHNTGDCECFPGFTVGTAHGTGACDTIVKNALRGVPDV
jgi:hypothetical protein